MKPSIRAAVARQHPLTVMRFLVHLPNFARLFWRLLCDHRVSAVAKGLLLATGAYILSPLDFLPDLMPLLGQLDDLTLFALGCRAFLQLCPKGVVQEHVQKIDTRGEWTPFGEQ
jgi:uncharacterized membrane protein YkvA (DUF1232 family)